MNKKEGDFLNVSDSCSQWMSIYVAKLASKHFKNLNDVNRFLKWKTLEYKFLFNNKFWRAIFKYFCLITVPLLTILFLNNISSSSKNQRFENIGTVILLVICIIAFLGKVIQILGSDLYASNAIKIMTNNANLDQNITSNIKDLNVQQTDLVLYNDAYVYVFEYKPKRLCFQNPYRLVDTLKYSKETLAILKNKQIITHFIGNVVVTSVPYHGYNLYIAVPLVVKKSKQIHMEKPINLVKIGLFLPSILVIGLMILLSFMFSETSLLFAYNIQLYFAGLIFLSEYSIRTMKKYFKNLNPEIARRPYKGVVVETHSLLAYMANIEKKKPYSNKKIKSMKWILCRNTPENLKILNPQHIIKGTLIDYTGHIKEYIHHF